MPPLWVPQWKAEEKAVFLSYCRDGGNTSSELSEKLHYRGVLIIYCAVLSSHLIVIML